MIQSFGNKLAEHLFDGVVSKEVARFPRELVRSAVYKLTLVNRAEALNDLHVPPGNQLGKKTGKLKEYWTIRINDQWRVMFQWDEKGPKDVQVVDYH